MKKLICLAAIGVGAWLPTFAMADTIDPTSYADTLGVGESVTITKTVTVEKTTSTALLDVMFIFDTTGSMGSYISAAKAKAADILTSLSGFGDLASGTGYYADPHFDGVHTDLTTNDATTIAGINDFYACYGDCGGDYPEKGYAAISDAAMNASWRPGSNRFIIALGDASFKTPPTSAETITALNDAGVTFLGVAFTSGFTGSAQPIADATGGDVYSASASGDSIATAITDGITTSLSTYSEVTVDDLGGGMPGVDVSVTCVTADTGTCVGDTAVGSYDRSVARTFTYDVTFTGLAAGDYSFPTHALVDGGIVASEADRITVGGGGTTVPAPGTLALLGLGLLGVGAVRRRAA